MTGSMGPTGMGPGMGPGIGPGWWPAPWTYPEERYYYRWWDEDAASPPASDGDVKKLVVERLKTNGRTKDEDIKVDVKQRVVILGGDVSSWVAKRAAGDDAWDTPGVVDVSNQLRVIRSA